jgi:PTH1 family peptidyl-tRNA hydrolase
LNWLNFFGLKKNNLEMKKFLIVGIGNIGKEYDNTRHNVGFQILDYISKEYQQDFEIVKYGQISKFRIKGKSVILLKPSTYVNLSGKAVGYWLKKEKIGINNLLVISDDLNLDFGKIRIKTKGTDGGHNGLKDISNVLGTNDYSRFRFGIGGNFPKGRQSDYVLSKWNNDEKSEFISLETHFIELFKSYLLEGIDITMNKFNG